MARKTRQAFPSGPDGPTPSPALDADDTRPMATRRAPMFAKGAASLETAARSAAAEERMYRNIAVELIDPSPIRDRIDLTEDLETLKTSLREDGQQIPILLRPGKVTGRYEIVTGRRRLQATRELGLPTIQAFVRPLSDADAFVAQGVENNARLETSFIERARTIVSALDAGFKQTEVERFLGVDQTMISRMKTIYEGLGETLVLAIGPARGVGRRKWDRLQKLVSEGGHDRTALAGALPRDQPSVERFEALLARLEATPAPARKPVPRKPVPRGKLADGRLSARRSGRKLVLEADKTLPTGFFDYLEKALPDLLEAFDKEGKKDD
ncbi:ParB/RepB/Spo0J family partition protein [Mesobacterium pallidum]|uniref:ParB/RepB/Spo0J family partition protein n=1 Tax=Mesobacterium pallidum TaxID=2872037 RepID=UPI001EE1AA1A|nr:ParB/RepB/Spo0J family partition protein [Mesobacterium pallidum]